MNAGAQLRCALLACVFVCSLSVQVGFFLPPLGQALKKDFGKTSTRFFVDLFKHSTAFNETRFAWDDATPSVASFSETGLKTSTWQHYGYPADAVTWRDDGYPQKLKRFMQWGREYRTSTVAHIGKDAPYVLSGLYICRWNGDGFLEFEKDAMVVQRDQEARTITLNITASTGVRIRLTDTNEEDPLHDITILPIDLQQQAGSFHPLFLEQLSGASVLRFSVSFQPFSENFGVMCR